MLETLLNLFENYNDTCPISKLRDGCVSFVRSKKYMQNITIADVDAWVIIPKDISVPTTKNIKWYTTDYPEFLFTLYHNKIHEDNIIPEPRIGKNCKIHNTVVLDVEGLKVVNTPSGEKIQFKHTGGVVIGDNVEIGPYSVVHRGTMSDTIIESGCKFGAYTNIAHNCHIGKNTIMAAGVITNGGVVIGEGCWVSSGARIKHYTTICAGTIIGLGTVVVRDIVVPGIYVGTPAKFKKSATKGWNF